MCDIEKVASFWANSAVPPPPGLDMDSSFFCAYPGECSPFSGIIRGDQLKEPNFGRIPPELSLELEAKSPQFLSLSDKIEIHAIPKMQERAPAPSDSPIVAPSSCENDKVRAQRFAAKKKDLLSQYSHHDGPIQTLMIRNIPCRVTQQQLIDIIDAMGFEGKYDFLYLPTGGRSSTVGSSNLGYGFINYEEPEDAELFQQSFMNYQFEGTTSTKVCTVKPAHIQGLQNNILHFDRTANKGRPRREGPFIRMPKTVQADPCPESLVWLENSYFGFLDDDSSTADDYTVGCA